MPDLASLEFRSLVLDGSFVRLEPLDRNHIDALWAIGQEPELWRWTSSRVRNRDDMRQYVETALAERDAATAIPFATTLRETGEVVGSTRFANIVLPHRRAEIGWTWIAPAWQRSRVNTEAKYLMLREAFETWGLMRVELKTNARNERSRAAILRLGAVEEGTLRKHMVQPDGSIRDTVYFSITDDEWPAVKRRLESALTSHQSRGTAHGGRDS